jgi:hypothetical protein
LLPRQDEFKYGAEFSFYKVDAMTIMRLFLVILLPFKNKQMSVSPVYTIHCYLCIVILNVAILEDWQFKNVILHNAPFLKRVVNVKYDHFEYCCSNALSF